MKGIYWLASYPKSGNTWLRAFLTNYWQNGDRQASINELSAGSLAACRDLFDDLLGLDSCDLTPAEIDYYRPLVYRQMAASSLEPLFIKVHDAFTYNADGHPIFPKQVSLGVIYSIRNPLDVAVSYAHHENQPVDQIIDLMGCETFTTTAQAKTLYEQLPQQLLSWSRHVRSWVDEPGLKVCVVRYEDMVSKPIETFTEIVRFCGSVEPERVQKAVDFSRFDRLQAQEFVHGFSEKQPTAKSFFRKGVVGSWQETLTESQVSQIVADHRQVMRRFGYLTDTRVRAIALDGYSLPKMPK